MAVIGISLQMLKEGQQIVRCTFEILVLCLQHQKEDEMVKGLVLRPPLIRQPLLPGNKSATLHDSKSKCFQILKIRVQIRKEKGGVMWPLMWPPLLMLAWRAHHQLYWPSLLRVSSSFGQGLLLVESQGKFILRAQQPYKLASPEEPTILFCFHNHQGSRALLWPCFQNTQMQICGLPLSRGLEGMACIYVLCVLTSGLAVCLW